MTESPYGRSLRAMRDNDLVADSLGKNLLALRAAMLVLGGALAGLSGGILVGFINLWAPAAWGYAETIVLFAAVIIGGAGSHPAPYSARSWCPSASRKPPGTSLRSARPAWSRTCSGWPSAC